MFSNIGSGEILIVVLVLLFLFGGKRLPELARGLGESGKELKKAKKEIDDALSDINTDETDQKLTETKSRPAGKQAPPRKDSKKGGEPS